MKEIITAKGVLKYRMPNIAEGMKFISFLTKVETNNDVWVIRSNMISNAKDLINYKEIGYSSFDEMLNDKQNMSFPLKEISEELYSDAVELLLKKN